MTPNIQIIGDHPFARDGNGKLKSRIATVFPRTGSLLTLPGIHATQRMAYLDLLAELREKDGLPPLTKSEQTAEWQNAVDVIVDQSAVLIRPDPDNMPLAFQADELLQQVVPKPQVRFLYARNPKVHSAIKRRGECWRINPLPRSPGEIEALIEGSRIGLGGREIYYHNRITGTRYLVYQDFAGLGTLDDAELRRHLREIQEFIGKTNPQGNPEIAFFLADPGFSRADFAGYDFAALSPEELQAAYVALERKFYEAVPEALRKLDMENVAWRNRLCAALIAEEDEVVSEEVLLGLSPEFFMQIEWLPGGRIEEGELILEPLAEEGGPIRVTGENAQKFIFNFVREYGDLEYVNIGRVIGSLSHRQADSGRRGVYLAEIKQRERDKEIIRILRLQKWGIREHLDEGKGLLDAIIQSEEYTEYTLDRRLGCRLLGMELPSRVTAGRIAERYFGKQGHLHGITIWSPYFERDYMPGMATDKIPGYRFENGDFALEFARLIGRAAAPNMIVGRCDLVGKVLFDDGDEVLMEDANHLPAEIIVADQTGTFADYRRDLRCFAADYAKPVLKRLACLHEADRFAMTYVEAFLERFSAIQQEYRRRKRAFDTLFKHRERNEGGSFAYRWEMVLDRLQRTDPGELAGLIEKILRIGIDAMPG
jgi:hypothetical protein